MKSYLKFSTLPDSIAFIEGLNAAMGYPRGNTSTYSIPTQHLTEDKYAVLVCDKCPLTEAQQLELITIEEATVQGYLAEQEVF